jgi:hypothetical protein
LRHKKIVATAYAFHSCGVYTLSRMIPKESLDLRIAKVSSEVSDLFGVNFAFLCSLNQAIEDSFYMVYAQPPAYYTHTTPRWHSLQNVAYTTATHTHTGNFIFDTNTNRPDGIRSSAIHHHIGPILQYRRHHCKKFPILKRAIEVSRAPEYRRLLHDIID